MGGVLVTTLAALMRPVQDPDFWWHLATGRWIALHLRPPAHDLFTFTVPDHVWVDHEYLTELLMWLAYRAGGLFGVELGFGLLSFVGFLYIYRTSEPKHRPYVIVALGLALAVLAGGPIWGPRPQMITFTFSCLELWWIKRYLTRDSRMLYALPLLMVLWANLHAGWVIEPAFLAGAAGTEAISYFFDRERPHLARIRTLLVIFAVSLVSIAVTPHGLSLYAYPFKTIGSHAQQALIQEWQSPNFHLMVLRPFEAMALLLLLSFALKRPSVYELLLSLAVFALALESDRNIEIFVAAATPVLISQWSDIWTSWSRAPAPPRVPARPWMGATTLIALILIAAAGGVYVANGVRHQNTITAQEFPVGAANYLAAHPSLGTRMFNQYGWGGYLIWRFYPAPNRRVYIFGEAELMGDAMLNQYEDVASLRANWLSILDSRRVDYVVDNRGGALVNALEATGRWRIAYQDNVAVVLVRKAAIS